MRSGFGTGWRGAPPTPALPLETPYKYHNPDRWQIADRDGGDPGLGSINVE
ncbi:MAG: hypothetical protein HC920_15790 [Oscillatoriales cyanobacterium SM2_3_0]|nr:hypothetical protein [Oscillatoriales cyanobacterium SM2_3_0]